MVIKMKILFQGDSITDGNRYKNPDQEWDKNHQIGHSFVYVINALLGSQYPEKDFTFTNRGISGNRILELLGRNYGDVIRQRPDLVSILAGVNDLLAGVFQGKSTEPQVFAAVYRMVLEELRRELPETALVLCEPFILPGGVLEERYEEWRRLLGEYQRTVKALAEEFGAVFLPLQERFDKLCAVREPSYWVWDGVHPTENGHGVIAQAWMEAARGLLGL